MTIVLLVILFLFVLFVFATIGRSGHKNMSTIAGWNYAHRGLFGAGIPENSMKAFRKAKEAGYGIELDIHLMKDGNLAVIHDSSLERVAGAKVFIEDLEEKDLSDYYLEGSLETIPLFRDVLDLYNGEAPLIIELKCERNNHKALCEAACKMLDQYPGAFCLESFDPRCIFWLRKNRPDLIRGQLSENYFSSPTCKLPWILKVLLSFHVLNFLIYPDFIAYRYKDRKNFANFLCRKLWRIKGVCWTIENKSDYETAVSEGWIPIFEKFLP